MVGGCLEFRQKPAVVPGRCMVAVLHLDFQWGVAGPAGALPGFPAVLPMANLPSRALRTMIRPAAKLQSCLVHSEIVEAFRH